MFRIWALFLISNLSLEVWGAKKDFKGLFGSYRKEKFVENEARSTDYGMDLLLSTLVPSTPLVQSDEGTGPKSLHYATFFNLEAAFFFTLGYHWELFTNIGWYKYDTRKENTERNDPTLPLFHQFELEAYPLTVGIKYRFSLEDMVPYVGFGVGFSYVRRKGFYDYHATFDQEYSNVLTAELIGGLEFFFHPRIGIRLEVAGFYLNLKERKPAIPGSAVAFPKFTYQGNLILVRYASGLFILF